MTPADKKDRIAGLRNMLDNFARACKSNDPRCLVVMEELNRLEAAGLEFKRSVAAIRAKAEVRLYISYLQVANASEVPWRLAHRPMNRHLDELCEWGYRKGWPLLTSIVVEKTNVDGGLLGKGALAGFMATARRLDAFSGGDEVEFLREQQRRVFSWAEEVRGHDLHA